MYKNRTERDRKCVFYLNSNFHLDENFCFFISFLSGKYVHTYFDITLLISFPNSMHISIDVIS